jgi:RND family efflux transporter MFP subunit
MIRKWLYPGLATSVVIAVGLLALFNPLRTRAQTTPGESAPKPISVEVVTPQRRDLVRQSRLPGTLRPWEETQLYAKASGYLREIRVDKGDLVKSGQLLAVLDIPEMQDDLAQQRAQERAAVARSREPVVALATARAELKRSQCEMEQTRADLEAARAAAQEPESLLASAQAEVAAARAAVQEPVQDVETTQANLRAAQEELQAAQADVSHSQAEYELRERIYQRYQRLLEREVLTQQEFDQAEAAYLGARASLDMSRTRANAMKERVAAAQSAVRGAQAKVATAQARAVTPEAQIANIDARANTARARVVAAERAVSVAETRVQVARAHVQEVSAKGASATSDVATAAAGARKTLTLLQYRRLTAPSDGVITERNVDPGQLIQASTSSQARPMLIVSNINRMRLMIPVPEMDVPHLKVGNTATFAVRELPGKTRTGAITRFTNDLDPVARTMAAEIDLPNPDRALRPGMYGDVVINLETHADALVVPTSAVVVEKQKRSLWVVRQGKAQKVEVMVGVDNGVDAEITSGIGDNDRIIVSGQTGLQNDQPVKPVQAKEWSGATSAAGGKQH